MNKRGQFFLLAAVIISAVIISLGAGTNRAVVNEEPDDFYASSDEAQREIGAFLDYAVYNNFNNDEELIAFLDLLAEGLREDNPDIDFAFVYGEGNKVHVKNYGVESIYVGGEEVEGKKEIEDSIVSSGGTAKKISRELEVEAEMVTLKDDYFSVGVSVEDEGLLFRASDYQQVIMVMQKDQRGDRYVSIG